MINKNKYQLWKKNFRNYTTYYYYLMHAYPDFYHSILNEDVMTGIITIDIMEHELTFIFPSIMITSYISDVFFLS